MICLDQKIMLFIKNLCIVTKSDTFKKIGSTKKFFKCDMLARTSKDLNSCPSALRQNLDKNPNLPK